MVVLALALVCGVSSIGGFLLLRSQSTEVQPETVSVVIATREISRGEVINKQNVAVRQWVADQVPPHAIGNLSEALNRTVMTPLLPGEAIMSGKLADAELGRGLAALIPAGQRAYTIQTSRVASSVAGFVLPGNRVDVLLTLRGGSQDATGGGSSTTLLQAVEILAVDQQLNAPTENRMDPQQLRSVTLLVSPDQASLLDLGQNMGTLSLSLRSPTDLAEALTVPATVNVLRYTQREPDVSSIVAKKPVVEAERPSLLPTPADTAIRKVGHTPAEKKTKQPRFEQTQTLRGRSAGRILVRADR